MANALFPITGWEGKLEINPRWVELFPQEEMAHVLLVKRFYYKGELDQARQAWKTAALAVPSLESRQPELQQLISWADETYPYKHKEELDQHKLPPSWVHDKKVEM